MTPSYKGHPGYLTEIDGWEIWTDKDDITASRYVGGLSSEYAWIDLVPPRQGELVGSAKDKLPPAVKEFLQTYYNLHS